MSNLSESPFLTIVTRTYNRPSALASNVSSIDAQTDADLQHLIIEDTIGLGMYEADCSLDRHKDHVLGEFVYILDDDDYLVINFFVAGLKRIVAAHQPDVIMVRAQFPGMVLPNPWGKPPQICRIGSPNFVVRANLWKHYIYMFCKDKRGGDFQLIDTLFKAKAQVYWWDQVVAKVPQVGKGRPEGVTR